MIRRPSRVGAVTPRPLTWAPPTLTSPITVPIRPEENRELILPPDQDYILQMPAEPLTAPILNTTHEAYVTIDGGRNIVLIGGHIHIPDAPPAATLTSPYSDGDTTLQLTSAAGLPPIGQVNLGGHGLRYTGIAPGEILTGVTRNSFSYDDAQPFPLPIGTQVWIGESNRAGLTLKNYTGVAHVEGLLVDGDLVDSVRVVTGSVTSVLQLQNCRLGRQRQHDPVHAYDGHLDSMQLVNGPATVRLDRVTMLTDGHGILNKSDLGFPCGLIQARDVDIIGSEQVVVPPSYMYQNHQTQTVWDMQNCWAVTARSAGRYLPTDSTSGLRAKIDEGAPVGGFCPEGVAGVGYRSAGYLP